MKIDLSPYDFVDFGCSAGGSTVFARDRLGGARGLGLDSDPKKVEAATSAGMEALVADVTTLNPNELGSTRFVIMSHFLEHLPSRDLAELCIKSACNVSEEFVFIRQPYFDADGYLFSLGMKLYWSHWSGHKNHMTSLEFHNILVPLLRSRNISKFIIFNRTRIEDSFHGAIHPLSSAIDCHVWEENVHENKKYYKFYNPVYHETGAVILKMGYKITNNLIQYLSHSDIVFDSDEFIGAEDLV